MIQSILLQTQVLSEDSTVTITWGFIVLIIAGITSIVAVWLRNDKKNNKTNSDLIGLVKEFDKYSEAEEKRQREFKEMVKERFEETTAQFDRELKRVEDASKNFYHQVVEQQNKQGELLKELNDKVTTILVGIAELKKQK